MVESNKTVTFNVGGTRYEVALEAHPDTTQDQESIH